MATITVYHKPTCSTCRNVIKLVEASGHTVHAINYYEHPFTISRLTALLKKGKLRAKDVIRTKEEMYKTLNLKSSMPDEEKLIACMVHYPDLLQRPLVEKGSTVILARPPETVNALL